MNSSASDHQKVVVVGASGFGRECLDVLEAMISAGSELEILGVLDDFPSEENLTRLRSRGIRYLGRVDNFLKSEIIEVKFLVGVGKPDVRELIVEKFEASGVEAFLAVHPAASIGSQVEMKPGVVVCSGATISTNVKLGRHVHLNPCAIIGHDSVLQDFVSINPGAVISGEVTVETGSLIGAAALVLQQLSVGACSTIGAGAVVTKHVPSSVVVKGVPGRWDEG